MDYFDSFVVINLTWGFISLIFLVLSERKPFIYTKFSTFLLIFGWLYLGACVPIFRDNHLIPAQLSNFYIGIAIILSIEVWILMLSTLLGIGLAKRAHDDEHQSYMLRFHKPLRLVFKPLWMLLAIINIINSSIFIMSN